MPARALISDFANVAATVFRHPAGYAVLSYHPGPWDVPELAAVFGHLSRLLLTQGWTRLLVDARHLPTLSEAAKEWVRQHWQAATAPRPAQVRVAMLLPETVFSRLAVSQLQSDAVGGLHYRNFADEEAAHLYMLGLPTLPVALRP